jgi:hypothetical protein
MTMSYMYNVKGILYWCVNREWKTNNTKGAKWPSKPWIPYIFHIRNGTRKYVNGMGNFTYPGPNGKIYPSLRLENFRDGIEDYEYYVLLKKEIEKLKNKNPGSHLIAEGEKLLKIPQDVAKAVNDYNPEPANLINHREKVAKMIEKLAKANRNKK